jgi:ABC-type multidrug transport system ATPase subunit
MRVLLTVPSLDVEKFKGIARLSIELYKGLKKAGIDVEIIEIYKTKNNYLNFLSTLSSIPTQQLLAKVDIIHGIVPEAAAFLGWIKKVKKVKTVASFNDFIILKHAKKLNFRLRSILRYYSLFMWKNAAESDVVCALSSQTAKEMEIFLKNINKSFNGKLLFSDLNLSIKEGKMHILYGNNGSGKTTLLRILAFLTKPDNGEIFYKIREKIFKYALPYSIQKDVLLNVSYLHQKNILLKGNVDYNIKIGKILRGEIFDEEFYRLIEMFGVFDFIKKYLNEISEGQRRIVCILRSLSVKWELILLDETFSNIDSNYMERLKKYLNGEKDKGKTIIIATPEINLVNGLNYDKILKLENGKITG